MEEVVASHPAIAECCVVGAHDDMKGQIPVGLVLIKDGATIDQDELEEELVEMVREKIGAIACFRRAIVVERLPKTRSGKILRRVIRQMPTVNSTTCRVPLTIRPSWTRSAQVRPVVRTLLSRQNRRPAAERRSAFLCG